MPDLASARRMLRHPALLLSLLLLPLALDSRRLPDDPWQVCRAVGADPAAALRAANGGGEGGATRTESSPGGAAVADLAVRFGSLPKGVVLEERAVGMEPVEFVQYSPALNRFRLNHETTYDNPVTRTEMVEVLEALARDDRLGLSLILDTYNRVQQTLLYGLSPDDRIVSPLTEADLFLCAIVFGWRERLTGVTLPQSYLPRRPDRRRIPSVTCGSYAGYIFGRIGQAYERVGMRLGVLLVPMSDRRAPDGGYLPDWDKLRANVFEETDKANRQHVLTHQDEYLKLPTLDKAARLGEAAAFARHLRECGIDLRALAEEMQQG